MLQPVQAMCVHHRRGLVGAGGPAIPSFGLLTWSMWLGARHPLQKEPLRQVYVMQLVPHIATEIGACAGLKDRAVVLEAFNADAKAAELAAKGESCRGTARSSAARLPAA